MKSTMLRRCLTAAVAFAAAAAVVAIAPPSTAEAQPPDSPFAGTFGWNSATSFGNTWAVSISAGGHITGSLVTSYYATKGSISGRVNDDGSYSFTMSVTAPVIDDPERGHDRGPNYRTSHSSFAGSLAPDGDGNLVGTPTIGASFTWVRQ